MIFYTNIYIHKICISRNINKNNKDIVTCIKDIFRKYMESFENKIMKIKKDIRERNKYKNLNRKRSRYDDRWRSKGARGFIFPPRHGEGYEKGVKKEMKGLRGGKLSFIKRKIGSRLSECNISTDSFGGNISSLGKNSIKSRRWGRKVREGGWRREWKRRRKNESWRNRERGRKHTRNRTGSQAKGRREGGKRYEDVRKSLKSRKKKNCIEIFISYRAIFISLAAIDPFNVWPLQNSISLIDRHARL